MVHIHGTPNGQFPHNPEPTAENLVGLADEVKRQKADVGFAQDPDGDRLSFRWFIYPEAGSYGRDVPLSDATAETTTLTLPADAAGKSIHVVLAVTDNGEPGLTRYRRVVIHVERQGN